MALGAGGMDLNNQYRSNFIYDEAGQPVAFRMHYTECVVSCIPTVSDCERRGNPVLIERSVDGIGVGGKEAAGDEGVRVVVPLTQDFSIFSHNRSNFSGLRVAISFGHFIAEYPVMPALQALFSFWMQVYRYHKPVKYGIFKPIGSEISKLHYFLPFVIK